jgi:hypothetical protein
VIVLKNPRDYPDSIASAESGRAMSRGKKRASFKIAGKIFSYLQPGWWCALDDPDDLEGQLVDEDNLIAEKIRSAARLLCQGLPVTRDDSQNTLKKLS